MSQEQMIEKIRELVEAGQQEELRGILQALHPADLAHLLSDLANEERSFVLDCLGASVISEILPELDESVREEVLPQIAEGKLTEAIAEMPSDEATDIVGNLLPEEAARVIDSLPAEESAEVRELLEHEEETAGGIMAKEYAAVPLDLTAEQALARIRAEYQDIENIYDVYVTDASGELQGTVSLRDLVMADPSTPLSRLMESHGQWVASLQEDQEEVARRMAKYDLVSMPVVDEKDKLVGQVSVDDVLDVVEEEATEDMYRMVGLSEAERVFSPFRSSVRRRLPWMYFNLLTAFLAATVVSLFEGTISQFAVLAVFMPIVAGMGGNTGNQTLTIFVRGLALGELTFGNCWKAVGKEILLGLSNGITVGVAVGIISYLWRGDYTIGVIIGAAMVLNLISAGASGALIPLALKRLKLDPAIGSSILLTTITDCGGFFFFLGLATLVLRMKGQL